MAVHDPGGTLIIGGGLCAAVIAARLEAAGAPFRLICPATEGGVDRVPLQTASGNARHRGLGLGWADGLGGTTNLWGGQLWPWAPEDHGESWPGWVGDLDDHYTYVRHLLDPSGGGRFSSEQRLWPALTSIFDVRSSSWLPRRKTSVRPRMRQLLRRRPGILVNGHARRVESDSGQVRVIVDGPNGTQTVRGAIAVIAAGTLGSLALLGRSRMTAADWPDLGKGMMDHTSFHVGTITAPDKPDLLAALTDRLDAGRRRSPKLVFFDEQSNRRAYAHFRPARPGALDLSPSGVRTGLRTGLAGIKGRHLPAPFGVEVRVDIEQLAADGHRFHADPSQSRLTWEVTNEERRTAAAIGAHVIHRLADALPGAVSFELHETSDGQDIYHLMGGAAFGSRESAVTDSEMRVSRMPLVAIAGLSIFPEAGVANPSYLAAAMASRLAGQIIGGEQ